jgi:hypothetical protein
LTITGCMYWNPSGHPDSMGGRISAKAIFVS